MSNSYAYIIELFQPSKEKWQQIFIVSFERHSKILLHLVIDSYALFFSPFQMKRIKFLLPLNLTLRITYVL